MSSMEEKKTTLERQKEFLKAYVNKGTINGACKETDIHRNTVRHWRESNTVFKEQFEEARTQFVEHLEGYAHSLVSEMAKNKDYKANPTLLLALLNANAPSKYRRFDSGAGDPAKELMQEFRQQVKQANKEKKEDKPKQFEDEVEILLKDKGIVTDEPKQSD
jgi:DNA-binding transcriptional MerR regulator